MGLFDWPITQKISHKQHFHNRRPCNLFFYMGAWGTQWEHTWELDGNMGPSSLHPQPYPKEGKNKRRRKVGPSLGHVGAHDFSFLKLFVSGLPFLAWASSTPSMFYFRVVGYLTNLFTNLKHILDRTNTCKPTCGRQLN